MLEALWSTHDSDSEQSSQVWRCKVSKGASGGDLATDTTVVLKLYYPGIYRQQGAQDQRWTNEYGLAENEAIAHDRFKAIQGVDVPFCYGFYSFNPLAGPRMIGVVLEDLVFATTDLHTYTVRSRKMQSDHREHMKFIDRMYCECIRTLCRVSMCKIALNGVGGTAILIIQPPPTPSAISVSTKIQLVFVGFGHTYTVEEIREMSSQSDNGEETLEQWLSDEASSMATDLGFTFGPMEVREWNEMEEERGDLVEEFPYLFY